MRILKFHAFSALQATVILTKNVYVNGDRFMMATMILIGQLIVVRLLPNKLDLLWTIQVNLNKVGFTSFLRSIIISFFIA